MKKICLLTLSLAAGFFAFAQNTVQLAPEHLGNTNNISLTSVPAPVLEADVFLDEANKCENENEFDAAVAFYNKAATAYKSNKMLAKYGATLLRLSDLHLFLGNFAEAESYALKQALTNYARMGSTFGQMLAYQQLGEVYLASNRLTESLWFYTQQGILAQRLNNQNAYIESVLGIAAVKIKKQDYNLATNDLNRAEVLAKTANVLQYNQLIKNSRATIAGKTTLKKG